VVNELVRVAYENADCGGFEPTLMARQSPEYLAAWLLVQWHRALEGAFPDAHRTDEMLALVKGAITDEDWPNGSDNINPPDLKLFGL